MLLDFSARLALNVDSGGRRLFTEEKIRTSPNATFGGTPGVIFEDPPGENVARIIRAAFIRDGVLFDAYADVESDFATSASIDAAAAEVLAILATLRPY